ncbi:hypothetical protein [Actinomadura litoris]|uniref:Uncharacterized protein n=1 Tax=Actinomadura litoris TaxID=2678616 RepID=A0A7K1LDU0_9ACTN|nr:hypothetical protein [Actinomadura litoris]MUN42584.1 hypothetical protein [Actinomadura litoris]
MRVRVVFVAEQDFDGTLVKELTVDAARLVLVGARGEALCDVPVASVRVVDRGPEVRTAELKGRSANHGRAWTREDREKLARLYGAKASMRELMEALGRTRGGIRSELVKLGLVERKQASRGEDGDG